MTVSELIDKLNALVKMDASVAKYNVLREDDCRVFEVTDVTLCDDFTVELS